MGIFAPLAAVIRKPRTQQATTDGLATLLLGSRPLRSSALFEPLFVGLATLLLGSRQLRSSALFEPLQLRCFRSSALFEPPLDP